MSAFYLEDYEIGALDDFGRLVFTESELTAFRARYDPAPAGAPLTASLWHLTAAWMGLKVRAMQAEAAALGAQAGYVFSPGVRDIVAFAPVRPGEVVALTGIVRSKRPSRSMPDWGVIEGDTHVTHQDGRLALHFRGFHFAPMRGDARLEKNVRPPRTP